MKEKLIQISSQGELESYVNTVISNGNLIRLELTNIIGNELMAKPKQWKDRVLGLFYGSHLSNRMIDSKWQLVHEKAKMARKELQRICLMHIQVPGTSNPKSKGPVPNLEQLIYQVHIKLTQKGQEILTCDEVLLAANHVGCACLGFIVSFF